MKYDIYNAFKLLVMNDNKAALVVNNALVYFNEKRHQWFYESYFRLSLKNNIGRSGWELLIPTRKQAKRHEKK